MLINDRWLTRRSATVALLVSTVALSPTACVDGDDRSEPATGTGVSSTDPGGNGATVVSPGDAAGQPDGTEVTVHGFLVEDSGVVVLAETLAESYPPQPGGASLIVDGLDLSGLQLEQVGSIRWTNAAVAVTGTINDGRLTAATVQLD